MFVNLLLSGTRMNAGAGRLRNGCDAQEALQNQMSGPQSLETEWRSEGISSENKKCFASVIGGASQGQALKLCSTED